MCKLSHVELLEVRDANDQPVVYTVSLVGEDSSHKVVLPMLTSQKVRGGEVKTPDWAIHGYHYGPAKLAAEHASRVTGLELRERVFKP